KVAKALKEGLEAESYSVDVANTGEEGFFLMSSQPFDLLVLDVMLPGRSGIEILSALRLQGPRIPVLILTARDAVEDRVRGLDAGADDYLVKPFAFAELVARLRALLRRDLGGRELFLRVDDLEIDLLGRRVVREGIELDLTKRNTSCSSICSGTRTRSSPAT